MAVIFPFVIGEYELVKRIGMIRSVEDIIMWTPSRIAKSSILFQARHLPTDRHYCYKMLDVPRQVAAHRFLHEVNFLMNMNHPNVIKVQRGFILDQNIPLPMVPGMTSNHRAVVVMELGKRSLTDWFLRLHQPSDCFTNTQMLLKIIEGLMYIHSKQMLHGHIRPDKIILDQHNVPKLTSFGLSGPNGEIILSRSGYSAPEIRYHPHSTYFFETDIFSLGKLLVQLYSEPIPFQHWFGNWGITKRVDLFLVFDSSILVFMPTRHFMNDYLIETATLLSRGHSDCPFGITLESLKSRIYTYLQNFPFRLLASEE